MLSSVTLMICLISLRKNAANQQPSVDRLAIVIAALWTSRFCLGRDELGTFECQINGWRANSAILVLPLALWPLRSLFAIGLAP
jgi:hypothetical protein